MVRRLDSFKLVVASHNTGKVREIADLMAPFGLETLSAGDLGLPEPEETGKTFTANAEIKALAAARAANLPALADDSGLEVDALGGDPGIYAARWAETPEGQNGGRDFGFAMKRVHEAMEASGSPDKTARFICALTLAWPDGHTETFVGTVEGKIVWPPRGDKGFGYDPIFVPDGYNITFGEMEPKAKHRISHRADAFQKMIDACFCQN